MSGCPVLRLPSGAVRCPRWAALKAHVTPPKKPCDQLRAAREWRLSLPPPVTFLCSPSVTVTSPAVGISDGFARLDEANNPSLETMGRSCLPDSKNSAGGAQKAPPAALSTQSVQLDREWKLMAVSATGVMPALARVRPEREKVGHRPVLHATCRANCHNCLRGARVSERSRSNQSAGPSRTGRPSGPGLPSARRLVHGSGWQDGICQ